MSIHVPELVPSAVLATLCVYFIDIYTYKNVLLLSSLLLVPKLVVMKDL